MSKSAVEEGALQIRNEADQKQNINNLSRDTENANHVLEPLFDKQSHLDTVEIMGLVKDIQKQANTVASNMEIVSIQNRLESKGYPTKQDIDKKRADDKLKNEGNLDYKPQSDDQLKAEMFYQKVQDTYNSNKTTGIGGSTTQGINAVSSLLAGILTGDIKGGLAGAAAPFIANEIKNKTTIYDEFGEPKQDMVAASVAHALLGAVVAQLQGNSALAGATRSGGW